MQTVLLEVSGSVATLTLNRPESLNALDVQMGEELVRAVSTVSADPSVRALVITGAGRALWLRR